MKKTKTLKYGTAALLAAAAVLLATSTVGSTRAALTYYSDNYAAEVTVSSIGISLLENGEKVGYRDSDGGDEWKEASGTLLEDLLAEEEDLVLGKTYTEEITVSNSGSIDSYVRVILTKSWTDAQGVKDTTLSPELIDLGIVEGNGWIVDEDASTAERTVLYYTEVLEVGETAPAVTDTVRIDPSIGTKVIKTEETDASGLKTITYVHEYDGYTFNIEAEVDAVQTHNAEDAIKSAWGVDVAVAEDGSLGLR